MGTFFDDASLVMIPSGVKEDKLYSIKPTNGSGDFTFSRGSDIQATRVNSSGLIEKAKVNNLTYSNDFSNAAWVKTGVTPTSGQAGYDGTNDAWLMSSTNTNGEAYQLSTNGVSTISLRVKAGNTNWIAFRILASNGAAWFNLSTGAFATIQSAIIDTNVESLGSGWYEISVTAATSGFLAVYIANGDNTFVSTSGNSIYIQDAQLNHGLIAQDYVETTTTAVVEGLTADLPRLDYSGGASCPSLLLEPSRTNSDTNSEYLANKPIVTNVSVTTNSTTSPEGVVNASTITNNTTNGQHQLTDNTFSVTSGTDYTISLFLKYNDAQYVRLQFGGTPFGSTNWQNFDVQNGTKGSNGGGITSADASIEDYGNGWYRCIVTADATATGSNGAFQIRILEDDNTSDVPSFAGTGLSTYAYGAQFEAGSYPTSYIPTYSAAANRGADSASKTGISSLIGQSEGTLFIDIVPQDKEFQIYYQARTTGSSNVGQIDIRYQSSNLKTLGADGGASNFSISFGDIVVGQRYKCAVRYAENDVAFYVNGSLAGTDTNASFSSSTKGQITFFENTGSFLPHAEVKQALVFTTGLTNAELAALTTI